MKSEDFSGDERFVKIRDGEWCFRNQCGRVETSIPITTFPFFSELAVLVVPGKREICYAARLGGTDCWAYYHHLQIWMYPLVAKLTALRVRYEVATELVAKAHQTMRGVE